VKRWAILLIAVAAIGAIVALAFGDSTVATAVAIALIGLAAVGAVSLAFYAIGEAEDRDRAEEEAQRRQETNGEPPKDPHPRSLGLGPERRSQRPPRRPQ
jgi:uncharacterized membrane protein YuzA (DUF378 family)